MRFFINVDNAGNINGQLQVVDATQIVGMFREGFSLIEIPSPLEDTSNLKWDFDTGSLVEKEEEDKAPE